MSKQRALIIGGSVGGLFAANMLRSIGWDTTVFERNAEELAGRGAGISTHPQLHAVTRRLGIPFDDSMGIAVNSVVFLDHDGRAYDQRDTVRLMSSWGRVFRSLRDPIPDDSYRLGKSLVRVEQDADSVTAIFADGARERGDLLIGADGGRSTVRELFLPGLQPEYAGYVAWRAMLDERDVPPAIHAQLFKNYTYCLPPGELFLAYPVPGRIPAPAPPSARWTPSISPIPSPRWASRRALPSISASKARSAPASCDRASATAPTSPTSSSRASSAATRT